MKQTAVEWLIEQINNVKPHQFCSLETIKEWCEQAKEIEKQQQDDFAIVFAEWIRVCKLKVRPYNFDNTKELLEIYKDEKGL